MDIKLVIFDMDGLMFDTERVSRDAWKTTGKELNLEVTDEIFLKLLGTNSVSVRNTLMNCFGEDSQYDTLISKSRILLDKLIDDNGLGIKKGLIDLLAHLKNLNIKTAVATSTSRERAMKLLKVAAIDTKFNYIICGDEVTKSKPNPEIFLKVAEKLNVSPENCLVLEDSRNGIYAARNANMKVIMVPDLLSPDDELLSIIYKKASHLGDIIDLIK